MLSCKHPDSCLTLKELKASPLYIAQYSSMSDESEGVPIKRKAWGEWRGLWVIARGQGTCWSRLYHSENQALVQEAKKTLERVRWIWGTLPGQPQKPCRWTPIPHLKKSADPLIYSWTHMRYNTPLAPTFYIGWLCNWNVYKMQK